MAFETEDAKVKLFKTTLLRILEINKLENKATAGKDLVLFCQWIMKMVSSVYLRTHDEHFEAAAKRHIDDKLEEQRKIFADELKEKDGKIKNLEDKLEQVLKNQRGFCSVQ